MKNNAYLMLVTASSEDKVYRFIPEYSAPEHYRDQAKIDDYIVKKQDAFIEKSKYHAMTAEVTGAFVRTIDGETFLTTDNSPEGDSILSIERYQSERELLVGLFALLEDRTLVGANVRKFHAPFLVRRSIYRGVDIPLFLIPDKRGYYGDRIIDLISVWSLGNREEEYKPLRDILLFSGIESSDISTMISDLDTFQLLPIFAQWSEGTVAVRQVEIAYNKLKPLI